MKTTKSLKTVAFALGLAAMTLPATTLNAQGRPGGLFGSQNAPTEKNGGSLLMRDGATPTSGFGFNIGVEQFGGENGGGQGGFNIGTEQFGNEGPLGSGLFILAAAGAAYAFSKKRKKQENN